MWNPASLFVLPLTTLTALATVGASQVLVALAQLNHVGDELTFSPN